jgi:hypothetical protein
VERAVRRAWQGCAALLQQLLLLRELVRQGRAGLQRERRDRQGRAGLQRERRERQGRAGLLREQRRQGRAEQQQQQLRLTPIGGGHWRGPRLLLMDIAACS